MTGTGGLLRASCPPPCGPHFVRSNSLPANLSNLFRFSSLHFFSINVHLQQRLYLAGPGGLLRASCPSPCGPHCVRSNSLPANLSNLLSVLIGTTIIYKRSFTATPIFGWAGRIRTSACQDQNLVPYRLATAQYLFVSLPLPTPSGMRRFMPGSHDH